LYLQLQALKQKKSLKAQRQEAVNQTFLNSVENKTWALIQESILPAMKAALEELQVQARQLKSCLETSTPILKQGVKSQDSVQRIFLVSSVLSTSSCDP
jgi:hypothetical protein